MRWANPYPRWIVAPPTPNPPTTAEPRIGTLNESSLHAALKSRYTEPGDELEFPLEGFVIDIVRDRDGANELLIEIQTGSFASLGDKLDRLLCDHRMLLVHPIAVRTTLDKPGKKPRRSPTRGSIYSLFDELVSIPTLLDHPHLELDVVLVEVTKVQVHDGALRRRRGGFRTVDRRMDALVDTIHLSQLGDLATLLPTGLPAMFTTADLVRPPDISRATAQKLAYCCKAAGLIEQVDRTAAGIVYRRRHR